MVSSADDDWEDGDDASSSGDSWDGPLGDSGLLNPPLEDFDEDDFDDDFDDDFEEEWDEDPALTEYADEFPRGDSVDEEIDPDADFDE